MARGFYTVIVGTQPGIYTDWTQAALRVSEISGAIFKKYKTYPDALEAFNNAARDGKIRAIQVDPEPEAELLPGPQIREQAPHEYPAVRPIIPRSAARPGQSFHKSRTTRSSTGAGMTPSMYASQSDLAERTCHGTAGTEPREHQRFGQPSRPADGNQVLLPTGSSSSGHGNERWQESQHDSPRALPILSRADRGTAFAHHEARSTSTSAEPERRRLVLESPSAAPSRSPQPGPSTRRAFRSPQMDDNRFRVPGNVSHQHDRPLSSSPLADALHVDPSHASGSQGPIVNPVASPRVHAHGMSDRKGKKRASVQSSDAYSIDSFAWSGIRRSAPSPQTGIMEIGDSMGPPGLFLRSSSPCSHISVASSNDTLSVFSFEVSIPAVETPGSPGRSAHVASSPQPPQLTVSPFAVPSLVENPISDPSAQSQEGLDGEDDEDDSQDLEVPSGDARFGNLGNIVDPPASVEEHADSSRGALSVLFDDSPTLTRLQSPWKVASTSRASSHLPTQSIHPSGLDSTSPPRVWPLWSPPLPPHVDQGASLSTEATGLGLSIEGIMSPRSHPLQHQMTTRAPLRIPPHRHVGSIDRQSTTGDDDTFLGTHLHLRPGITIHLQHLRIAHQVTFAGPTKSPSESLHAVLPHPGSGREDDQQRQRTLLSPSGLDVPLGFASGFGRPTPHSSPTRAPAPHQQHQHH
ncbi:hypothetical protein BGY98DRAFT_1177646 [Russula aff. rugulosa BPL654]|nr:hypothetical protein BGY98DRAFT_1177646 [Russula aff. rugulosa BPL654]